MLYQFTQMFLVHLDLSLSTTSVLLGSHVSKSPCQLILVALPPSTSPVLNAPDAEYNARALTIEQDVQQPRLIFRRPWEDDIHAKVIASQSEMEPDRLARDDPVFKREVIVLAEMFGKLADITQMSISKQ